MTPVLEGLSWPVVAPARDHPRMLGDDLAFGANHDAFGVSPHTDRAVGERGRHAVAITLQGERLEAACQRAVASDSPSRKSVLSILEQGLDKVPLDRIGIQIQRLFFLNSQRLPPRTNPLDLCWLTGAIRTTSRSGGRSRRPSESIGHPSATARTFVAAFSMSAISRSRAWRPGNVEATALSRSTTRSSLSTVPNCVSLSDITFIHSLLNTT